MTTPDGYIPEGARPVAGVKDLQALNEAAIKRQLQIPAQDLFDQVRGGFATDLIKGIAGAIRGIGGLASIFTPVKSAADTFRDGQTALNNRTDLLMAQLDYGSVWMSTVSGWSNTGIMPFNKQIGPMRNLKFEQNGIRLLDVGQWDISAAVTASWVRIASAEIKWRIKVTRADGTLFSQQYYTMTNANVMTMTLTSSVVVDEPGVLVQVDVMAIGAGRSILGGSPWNRLTVKHMSRSTSMSTISTEADVSENPDGDIVVMEEK